MRTWILLSCLLLVSVLAVAQQAPSNQATPNGTSPYGTPGVTVVGCVQSLNGYFTLETQSGDAYRLKGDHDTLFSYNGKEVAISGSVKSSDKGRTLQVSKIKKVSDTCQ